MANHVAAGITLKDKIVYGVIAPVALLVLVAVVHLFWVLSASVGSSEDWNVVILFVYVPIIVGVAALIDCWVLFTAAETVKRIFRRGAMVPLLAYVLIILFTLWLYYKTPRRFPAESHHALSNQAMQRTAPRSVLPLSVATIFNLQAHAFTGAVADLVSR